ncbi:MAG: hypothetical protein QOF61_1668 [Acidobacteriota bacterium]|nr:hypothetical protein [Acidobacteriota bacterium]
MWRSLVARTLGVGEAPSSNLGIPITKKASDLLKSEAFLFVLTSIANVRMLDDRRDRDKPCPYKSTAN